MKKNFQEIPPPCQRNFALEILYASLHHKGTLVVLHVNPKPPKNRPAELSRSDIFPLRI